MNDDWPPVATEGLPFRKLPIGYELMKPPLFVPGLSVGDQISPRFGEDGLVLDWSELRVSDHSTVWLLRMVESPTLDRALQRFAGLRCQVVSLPRLGAFAIDIPPTVSTHTLDEVLEDVDDESVAVAYPSFRHPDG